MKTREEIEQKIKELNCNIDLRNFLYNPSYFENLMKLNQIEILKWVLEGGEDENI